MAGKTKIVKMVFDREKWAEVLKALSPDMAELVREIVGITESGWYIWINPDKRKLFEHPRTGNFLTVCNLLDLDPRDFFRMED